MARKLTCMILVLLMALTAIGTASAQSAEITYTPGTYTATVPGRNGNMTVEATFSENRIESVKVLEHEETAMFSDAAIERIPEEVVEYQSLDIDAVSYATISSAAVLSGVAECAKQAGADVAALKKAPVPEKKPGETVNLDADVVIVGGGGAGVAAALSAAQNGATVIVVEKTSALGGNTLLSGGLLNAAYPQTQAELPMTEALKNTLMKYATMEPKDEYMAKWQKKLLEKFDEYEKSGSESLFDCIELHMIQTYVDGDYCGNPELIEYFCTNAPLTLDWIQELGTPLKKKASLAQGMLWQRGNYLDGYKSGVGFIKTFTNEIEKQNYPVEYVYEVRANSLIVEDGKVVGVKGNSTVDGTEYVFNASKGVLLATGGFGANVEMRCKYNSQWPDLGSKVPTTNSPAIQGDGIVMAMEIGAATVDMDKIQLLPVADPRTGETNSRVGDSSGLYLNKEGVRFVAEDSRRDVMAAAILAQTDSCMWLISSQKNSLLDENGLNKYGRKLTTLLANGTVYMADTLEELAEKIGLDPQVMVESVNKYNEAVDKGYDEEFGRSVFNDTARIDDAPFYACLRSPAVHHTMGGVVVDDHAHVYNEAGEIIPGLYAAGEVTGGFHGANRIGGNAIAEALSTGRVAGECMAKGE